MHPKTASRFNGPQPLSREGSASLVMDETDEIQVVRHRRELAAHGQQREIESTVEHGPNSGIERTRRTMDSQRTANSGLTGCLSLGVHFTPPPRPQQTKRQSHPTSRFGL